VSAQFFNAIRNGDTARVIEMIDHDPALLNARDEQGLGAYTAARYSRQQAIADMLLERGVELDLFAATMAGKQTTVAERLAADPGLVNTYSHDGWTPLHLAAFFGQPRIAETLLNNGADVQARSRNQMANTPLHAAVAGRQAEIARILLAHGADVNAKQQGGYTVLHSAAQNGDLELAETLIAAGANVNARADNNQSALDFALTKGHQALVDLLDRHGAE
jgi:ankyrin repeat protein